MAKDNLLSRDIKISKKESFPSKKTMNFVSDKQAKTNKLSIVIFVIFLVLLLIFTKFFVIDSISKTNDLISAYNANQSQLDALNEQLSDYEEIETKYNELVGVFLNDDEKNCLNRTDIIKLLDDDVLPYVDITNYTVSSNQVNVYTGVSSLSTISNVLDILQKDDRTHYVTINRTVADSEDNSLVSAEILITFADLEGGNNWCLIINLL